MSVNVTRYLLSAAGTGNLRVAGLPFAAAGTTAGGFGHITLGYRSGWTTTGPNGAYVEATLSYINLSTVSTATTSLTQANLSATTDLMFSGFYQTTA